MSRSKQRQPCASAVPLGLGTPSWFQPALAVLAVAAAAAGWWGVTTAAAARALVAEGDSAAAAGLPSKAAAAYAAALKRPELQGREVVAFNLGLALREDGRRMEALHIFYKTLMALDRADARAHEVLLQISEVAAELGAWKIASLHWRAAAALRPAGSPERNAALSNAAAALLNERSPAALANAAALLRVLLPHVGEGGEGGEAERGGQLDGSVSGTGVSSVETRAKLGVALLLGGERGEKGAAQEEEGAAHLLTLAAALRARRASALSSATLRAAVYAAFAVEEFRSDLARTLLQSCLEGGGGAAALGAQASSVFYRLGGLLRRAGELQAERELYESAVAQRVWASVGQRPGYLFPRPLLARPFHDTFHVGPPNNESSVGDAREGTNEADLTAAVAALEDGHSAVRREVVGALGLGDAQAIRSAADRVRLRDDEEGIADAGVWQQLVFARNGRRVEEAWNGELAHTEQLLASLSIEGGVADRLPKGSMEVSILRGGTHLKPHCGPTNHRLRIHLPLLVPTGGSHVARIRVGGEVRAWVEGQVLMLDDSFDHEAWNEADSARVVLLVDVWHPQLNAAEREAVRAHFRFDETSWWTTGSPWGRGVVQ